MTAQLSSPPAVLAGRYRLEYELGSGPHTQVWRGTDLPLNRPVAIRVLSGPAAADPDERARLRDKARLTGAVSHPGITRVYDYNDSCPGCPPFLVTELVEGPVPPDVGPAALLGMLVQLAWALDAAHRAGLRHGALTPGNVLESSDGVMKLTDFGGTTAGTVADDLLALGGLLRARQAGPPPEHAAGLINWLTDPDPARRPADAASVARRAGEVLAQLTIPRQHHGRWRRPPALRLRPEGFGTGGHAMRRRPATHGRRGRRIQAAVNATAIMVAIASFVLGRSLSPQVTAKAKPSGLPSVLVSAAALRGQPVASVRDRLTGLGLTVAVQWRDSTQVAAGAVITVWPAGRVPAHSAVVLTGALRHPAGHPAAAHTPVPHQPPGLSRPPGQPGSGGRPDHHGHHHEGN